MNAALPDLIRSRRKFFSFLIKRAALGTVLSLIFVTGFLWADIGGITSLMLRANDSWLWIMFFGFDFWVTVTGITIAIGLWNLGDWRDPPG
tara:strand:- start:33576 stop:33848 length:273 start_codon:yes stop_codon:yes gene_type:complete